MYQHNGSFSVASCREVAEGLKPPPHLWYFHICTDESDGKMIICLLETNIIANFNFSQRNILKLIGGEGYDIPPPPHFLRPCRFLEIFNGYALYKDVWNKTKLNLKHI